VTVARVSGSRMCQGVLECSLMIFPTHDDRLYDDGQRHRLFVTRNICALDKYFDIRHSDSQKLPSIVYSSFSS
jgi:hypothetical protein